MSNYNLIYAISKRTPASPKVLKEILDAQAAVNRSTNWTHEMLNLSAPRDVGRVPFAFPVMRFGQSPSSTPALPDGFGAPAPMPSSEAFAQGSTRVRDNIWNAHVIAAFLRHVSRTQPTLLFELRDEGGFVIPGAVWIRGGSVEANRDYLNRERARALELSGDPQAAVPFIWAEIQGLSGTHFLDASARDFSEMPEIRGLDLGWDQLEAMSLADVASLFVERATKQAVAAKA